MASESMGELDKDTSSDSENQNGLDLLKRKSGTPLSKEEGERVKQDLKAADEASKEVNDIYKDLANLLIVSYYLKVMGTGGFF